MIGVTVTVYYFKLAMRSRSIEMLLIRRWDGMDLFQCPNPISGMKALTPMPFEVTDVRPVGV